MKAGLTVKAKVKPILKEESHISEVKIGGVENWRRWSVLPVYEICNLEKNL